MLKKILVLPCLLGLLHASPALAKAECFSQRQLLELDLSVETDVQPCDIIGGLYILGLGDRGSDISLQLLPSDRDTDVANTDLFNFSKTYVRLVYGQGHDQDVAIQDVGEAISLLVGILANLPSPEGGDSQDNLIRFDDYRSFALVEYGRWMG